MPVIRMKPDTLSAEIVKFEQKRLEQPVFLNSVPKSGSHLLHNIVRMFTPVDQQYNEQAIQWPNLQQHLKAFDKNACYLSWGHLLFTDVSTMELKGVRKILLVRDPYSWVLARARFFLSDEFSGNIDHIKGGALTVDDLLNLMIFGVYQKAPKMSEIFTHNAVSWMGSDAFLVRYEELLGHVKNVESEEAATYFSQLFERCGINYVPDDWRERVKIGSDRKHSATARENLSGLGVEIPNELPDIQKQMVDYAAPGLRAILGYK